jgi:hypothetical protein
MVNQEKQQKGLVYHFRAQLPRNIKGTYALDLENVNSKWEDPIESEIESLNEFNTFKDHDKIAYVTAINRL